MNIKKIPLDAIEVGDRLRQLDPVYVSEIAASFDDKGGEGKGQISPIEVREAEDTGRYRLIAGLHRYAAAKQLLWKSIQASVVRCTNDEARLREIDENLVRRDLNVLDRAAFMAAREAVWNEIHPETIGGRAGANSRYHATTIIGFAANAAKSLGVSPGTIRDWLHLARETECLTGELRARGSASDLGSKRAELRALAGIEDVTERQQVVDLMLSGEKDAPRKVEVAQRKIRLALDDHLTPDQKALDKFKLFWLKHPKIHSQIAEFVRSEMAAKSRGRKAAA